MNEAIGSDTLYYFHEGRCGSVVSEEDVIKDCDIYILLLGVFSFGGHDASSHLCQC